MLPDRGLQDCLQPILKRLEILCYDYIVTGTADFIMKCLDSGFHLRFQITVLLLLMFAGIMQKIQQYSE